MLYYLHDYLSVEFRNNLKSLMQVLESRNKKMETKRTEATVMACITEIFQFEVSLLWNHVLHYCKLFLTYACM